MTTGLQVVLEQGFGGASVRDVVRAAGVPQGSFTNHFPSKEAFGIAVLDQYLIMVRRNLRATLLDPELDPLARLNVWFDLQRDFLMIAGMRNGCLIGNLSLEAVASSEPIRDRLRQAYGEIHEALATCLHAAAKAGQIARPADAGEVARFLYAALQGSVMTSKVDRCPEPFERFKRFANSVVLRPPVTRARRTGKSRAQRTRP